uniref:Uncharacterized protein n=1 Tax=Solanum tuberosum TaxID=4113 RepID=M1B7J6_SOLTU
MKISNWIEVVAFQPTNEFDNYPCFIVDFLDYLLDQSCCGLSFDSFLSIKKYIATANITL